MGSLVLFLNTVKRVLVVLPAFGAGPRAECPGGCCLHSENWPRKVPNRAIPPARSRNAFGAPSGSSQVRLSIIVF